MRYAAIDWRLPSYVPPFSVMLDNLGNPSAKKIARGLGVSESTARRWIKTDNPPKTVLYATFWLTTWGRQHIHIEAENSASMHAGLYECLRRENENLRRRIEYLERVGVFGSANDPVINAGRSLRAGL